MNCEEMEESLRILKERKRMMEEGLNEIDPYGELRKMVADVMQTVHGNHSEQERRENAEKWTRVALKIKEDNGE